MKNKSCSTFHAKKIDIYITCIMYQGYAIRTALDAEHCQIFVDNVNVKFIHPKKKKMLMLKLVGW